MLQLFETKKTPFKKRYTLEQRQIEAERIMKKYPERIPIVVETAKNSTIKIDKDKYLVPLTLSCTEFLYILRKRCQIDDSQAIFIFIGNTLPASNALMGDLYRENKDECGFLFITISEESVFG